MLSAFCWFLLSSTSQALPLKIHPTVGPRGWVNTNLVGATFISDIAVLGSQVYAGGLLEGGVYPLEYLAGQLWLFTPPATWTAQYSTPLVFSKVESLITNAAQTLLYSSVGNVDDASVDSFTPLASAPVALDDISTAVEAASTVVDLSLGPDGALFAAGGTTEFPPLGEVWRWDGTNWNSTDFSAKGQGTAIWLTYATPGLYVAANTYTGTNPVVWVYLSSTWRNTNLPVDKMNALNSLNVDSHNNLYAVGATTSSGSSKGSLLIYQNSQWAALPVPTNSNELSVIAFRHSPRSNKDFIYAGGLNKNGVGAVWYGAPCPSAPYCWYDTELSGASDITAMNFSGRILYAGGTSTEPSVASIWSLVTPNY